MIRIQMGNLPPLLADMVVALLGGPSAAEVVGRSALGEDPIKAARAASADLVVVARTDSGEPLETMLAIDHLAVLALPADNSSDRGRLLQLSGSDVRLDRGVLGRLAVGLLRPASQTGVPG